ncbi:MAG: hypothetical protein A3K11_08985 [Nitrospirae bacterium RIFCSPLOWO2_12_FULL_63_8]|nr:MAG: hypothetical protein A3K11_08985 [Nitrospirae bacterium RIFCSPLOWO2_12_FULL_63_8]
MNRSAELPLGDFSRKRFHLIDQHDRYAVSVAGRQVGVFINIHAGEREGGLSLDLLGDALDHVAKVAFVPGEDGYFNHGCVLLRRLAKRQESVDLIQMAMIVSSTLSHCFLERIICLAARGDR